jgi:hypothetical protein
VTTYETAVQSVVSGDAIVQASATIVVGVIFLVTLRQVLNLPVSSSYLTRMLGAFLFFAAASMMAFNMENVVYSEQQRWQFGTCTMLVFDSGLMFVALMLYEIITEKRDQERTEKERQDKEGKAFLKRLGVEINRDRKYMKKCVSCDNWIPLASEICGACQARQPGKLGKG